MASQKLPKKAPCSVEALGVDRLTTYLHISGITLAVGEGDTLTINYEGAPLPEWMKEALAYYKGAILDILRPSPEILAKREAFQFVYDRICRMRFEDPAKGTREAGQSWLRRKIEELAGGCDLVDGYTDPGCPFADSALLALRMEMDELTAPGNPYPIPKSDPRPRFTNGKLE